MPFPSHGQRLEVVMMLMLSFASLSCDRPLTRPGDLPAPKLDLTNQKGPRKAVFAGGCFWCTEAVFEQLDGVSNVVSGYAGGDKSTATYGQVCEGNTGHAEAIQITYDPARISYGKLLRVFFTTHDPTSLDRQGPDAGSQYRSAIFYDGPDQKRIAEAYIEQLGEAKIFAPKKIVTTLEPLEGFYPAEQYHQDFARKHPENPYIQQWAVPKVQKVIEHFVHPATTEPTTEPK
jgi:peptide-methionine (S)-S-oxide reductase